MEPKTTGKSPFLHRVPVRIRDIDFAGHAHHSAALLYFEEARAAYWSSVVGRGGGLEDVGYVLAEATVRYVERVLYPDTLHVTAQVVLLGRKHFVMEYEARSAAGGLLLSGKTTQVMYDYDQGASVPIPGPVRVALTKQDGPFASDSGC